MTSSNFTKSLIVGIIGSFITLLLLGVENWKIALLTGLITFIITYLGYLYFDPQRRYFRAFKVTIGVLCLFNRLFYSFAGNLFGVDFKFGVLSPTDGVSIGLIFLALYCLHLDYKQNDKDDNDSNGPTQKAGIMIGGSMVMQNNNNHYK